MRISSLKYDNDFNDIEPDDEQCCSNPCIEEHDGNNVCINCGMVFGRCIIGTERRIYSPEEEKEKKRTEQKWRNFGARTILCESKKDSNGDLLEVNEQTMYLRLSKIQKSLISSIERNLWEAFPKLKMLSEKLIIPEHIRKTAWRIYVLSAKKKLTMGRSIDGFMTASLYSAIRIHEFPRMFEELCDISIISRRVVHKSLGIIIKDVLPDLKLRYKPISPEQLVFRFGNDLKLSLNVQKKAVNLLRKVSKNGLERIGKDPKGIAAAVLYMIGKENNEKKTQNEISEVAKVTEVTLRTRISEIKELMT